MALLALALLFAQQNDCSAAADAFRRGDLVAARTLLSPAPPQTPFCLKLSGLIYAATGDYRSSLAPFASACRLNRNEPDACYYWARALYSLDRFEDSLAALSSPSAAKPWKLLTARGQALDALGRPAAEADLRRALSLRQQDPSPLTEPDPLLALAAFLYRQGRAPEALTLLNTAPTPYRQIPAFHYQTGRALAQAQRWPDAAESLKNAISLDPNYSEAHGLLSRVYYRLNQPDLAAHHARRATQGSTTSK